MEVGDYKDISHNKMEYLEMLAEPKNRFDTVEMKFAADLPLNPLPTWKSIPLDHKLPMIQGPIGTVKLFTTKIGEKIHKQPRGIDFDLTDPYSIMMSNYYKPLHDPHLKPHLCTPHMRNRLIRHGFITRDGKVLCTLREFNDYRQYLRKINLLLQKKEQSESGMILLRPPRRDNESATVQRQRAKRVNEVRSRLSQQREQDKAKYLQLRNEEEERLRRLREKRLSETNDKERAIREEEERRQSVLLKRQQEERRRKHETLSRWLQEDKVTQERIQARRKREQQMQQKRLAENWELRRTVQERMLSQTEERHARVEAEKERKIRERNEMSEQRKIKQQEMYQSMIERQRKGKELAQQRYEEKLSMKLEKNRQMMARKRKRRRMHKPKVEERRSSLWDLETSLHSDFPLGSGGDLTKKELSTKHLNADGVHAPTISTTSPEGVRVDVIEQTPSPPPQHEDSGGAGEDTGGLAAPRGLVPNLSSLSACEDISASQKIDQVTPNAGLVPNLSSLSTCASSRYSAISNTPSSTSGLDMYNVIKANSKHKIRRPTPQIKTGDVSSMKNKMKAPSLGGFGEEMEEEEMEEEEEEKEEEYELGEESSEEEDAALTDMEKASKGIVQMSLYLTTEVIMPAYIRWLEEDHPSVHEKFVSEPHTPLPDILHQVYGSESVLQTSSHQVKRKKSKGVQFQATTEIVIEQTKDYSSYTDSPTSLESPAIADYDDDEEEEEPPICDRRLSLSYRDSVERLHLSNQNVAIAEEPEEPEVAGDEIGPSYSELTQLLKSILDELSSGRLLSTEDVQEMTALAKHILENMKTMSSGGMKSPQKATPEQRTSPLSLNISTLAQSIISISIDKVKQNLLNEDSTTDTKTEDEKRADFAQYIVNEAVTSAVQQLQEATTHVTSQQKADDVTGKTMESKVSSTTDFIWKLIGRTARDVHAEFKEAEAKKEIKEIARDTKSTTSDLICNIIERAAEQIDNDLRRVNDDKTSSDTALFVKYVVDAAAKDLQAKASLDAKATAGLDKTYKPPTTAVSKQSSLSQFVQYTLQNVINEMEKEGTFEALPTAQAPRNASSLFAENLVECTLQQQLIDIKNDVTKKDQLAKMAATMLTSQKSYTDSDDGSCGRSLATTQSLDLLAVQTGRSPHNVSSMLAEALIRETLGKVLKEIKFGTLSNEAMDSFVRSIGKSGFAYRKTDSGETSIRTEEFVTNTIKGVLKELGVDYFDVSEKEALDAVEDGLKEAMRSRSGSKVEITPAKIKSSKSVDVFIQGVLQAAIKDVEAKKERIHSAALSVSSSVKSKSSEELSALIYDVVNEAAAKVAQESGIVYEGMDVYTPPKSEEQPLLHSASSDDVLKYITDIIETSRKQLSKESIRRAKSGSSVSVVYKGDVESFVRDVINETTQELSENVVKNKDSGLKVVVVEGHPSNVSNQHEHIIIQHSDHSLHEDSSEENIIEPMFHEEAVPVEHHAVEDALAIISVKKDKDLNHIHVCEAVQRNSFRDLFHPNLERVRRLSLDAESQDDVCKKILTLSSRCMETLQHPDDEDEEEEEAEVDSAPSVSEEEDSILPDTLMSITKLHNPLDVPDEFETEKALPPVKSNSSKLSPYHSKILKNSKASIKSQSSQQQQQRSWKSITAPTSSSLLKKKEKVESPKFSNSPVSSKKSFKSQSPVKSSTSRPRAPDTPPTVTSTRSADLRKKLSQNSRQNVITGGSATNSSFSPVAKKSASPAKLVEKHSSKSSPVKKQSSLNSKKSEQVEVERSKSTAKEQDSPDVKVKKSRDKTPETKPDNNIDELYTTVDDSANIDGTTSGTKKDAPPTEIVWSQTNQSSTTDSPVYYALDTNGTNNKSNASLQSAPPDVTIERADEMEEINEEIETQVKYPSKHGNGSKHSVVSVQSERQGMTDITMQSSSHPFIPTKPPVPPKQPKSQSSRASISSRRSQRSGASIGAPRPSSGYRKSPTPHQSLAGSKHGSDPEQGSMSAAASVTSRIMKSITSIGEKLLGRKSTQGDNLVAPDIVNNGLDGDSIRDDKSPIPLSPKESISSLLKVQPSDSTLKEQASIVSELGAAAAPSKRASCVHSECGDECTHAQASRDNMEAPSRHHSRHHKQPSTVSLPV